jgi:acetolactate synthase-1/2/3 large subunit
MAIGIHTALQDSTPLVAVIGQAPTDYRHREAFQEADLTAFVTPITKWAVEIPSAEKAAEVTERAVKVAMFGRPGPVALIFREDVLSQDVPAREPGELSVPRAGPDPAAVAEALRLLRSADRPVLLVGGGIASAGAQRALVEFAELEQIPVLTAWRRPDAFPNDHPLYLGWAGLRVPEIARRRLEEADVVLAVGTRLGEMTTFWYAVPAAESTLIHADTDPLVLGGRRWPDLPIVSDARLFFDALVTAAARHPIGPSTRARRSQEIGQLRTEWEARTTPRVVRRDKGVDQQAVVAHLRALMAPETIVTCDAGNFTKWPARYMRWNEPGTFLAPTSGAMGYAVPAAVAAKLARPERPVLALVGDGGMLMTGPEVETAVREETPFVIVVFDNEQYGTIRAHHELTHPGRSAATKLGPVDFARLADSLGADGYTVRDEADFPIAFTDATQSGRVAVIHVHVDPEQLKVEP